MKKETMIQKIENIKRAARYTTWTDKNGFNVKDSFGICTLTDEGFCFSGCDAIPYDKILDVEMRPYFNGVKMATVMFTNGAEKNLLVF